METSFRGAEALGSKQKANGLRTCVQVRRDGERKAKGGRVNGAQIERRVCLGAVNGSNENEMKKIERGRAESSGLL